jgi:hypothetical protein
MKGDFNKWEEIFHRVILRDSFNNDVKKSRKSLGIPIAGFFSEEKRLKWLSKNNILDVWASELELLKRYNLPLTCRSMLSNYLFFNGEVKLHSMQKPVIATIDKYTNNKNAYKEFGQPFVKLYIFDDSNLKGVQKFIKDNWETVKGMFFEQRQIDIPEVKRMRNKQRDKEVFQMYQKSREQLGLKKGESKDRVVANLLKVKYPGLTDDNVRKIVGEQKALRE